MGKATLSCGDSDPSPAASAQGMAHITPQAVTLALRPPSFILAHSSLQDSVFAIETWESLTLPSFIAFHFEFEFVTLIGVCAHVPQRRSSSQRTSWRLQPLPPRNWTQVVRLGSTDLCLLSLTLKSLLETFPCKLKIKSWIIFDSQKRTRNNPHPIYRPQVGPLGYFMQIIFT